MKVEIMSFGNQQEKLYRIHNDHGMVVDFTNYGARIVNWWLEKNSQKRNIVLGFDRVEEYKEKDPYIGASIGRVAGRVKNGRFWLQNKEFQTNQNEGAHTLHGGENSFESKCWEVKIDEEPNKISLYFFLESPAMENGFPGKLKTTITHTITNQNEWKITYQAMTDTVTLFNPTNHVYFNLDGTFTTTIEEHKLFLAADQYAEVDDQLLPTGKLANVLNSPFDYQEPKGKKIGLGLHSGHPQVRLVNGYDHPFVLQRTPFSEPKAILWDATETVKLKMYTDQPSVVVYTTNQVQASQRMHEGCFQKYSGITLETQHLPDAIHHQGFGDIQLRPTENYFSQTVFKID